MAKPTYPSRSRPACRALPCGAQQHPRRLAGQATPNRADRAKPILACLALPELRPMQSTRRLACHTVPDQAGRTPPHHVKAMACQALPSLTMLRYAKLACRALPRLAKRASACRGHACQALPRSARSARTSHACLAQPGAAGPCHASACLSRSIHACPPWRATPSRTTPRPAEPR